MIERLEEVLSEFIGEVLTEDVVREIKDRVNREVFVIPLPPALERAIGDANGSW